MTPFNPHALADRVIRERGLGPNKVFFDGEVWFSPSVVGDAAYIRSLVYRLGAEECRALVAVARVTPRERETARKALRARSDTHLLDAIIALAVLILRKLGVTM